MSSVRRVGSPSAWSSAWSCARPAGLPVEHGSARRRNRCLMEHRRRALLVSIGPGGGDEFADFLNLILAPPCDGNLHARASPRILSWPHAAKVLCWMTGLNRTQAHGGHQHARRGQRVQKRQKRWRSVNLSARTRSRGWSWSSTLTRDSGVLRRSTPRARRSEPSLE